MAPSSQVWDARPGEGFTGSVIRRISAVRKQSDAHFTGLIPVSQGLRFPLSLVPLSLFLLLPRRTSMRFSNGMHSLASVGCEQLSSPTFLNVPSSTDRLRCAENDISSSARLKVPRESDRAPPSPETRLDSVQIPSPPPGSLRGRKFCEGRFVPPCSAAHPT